jgi:hypothetical protein
MNLRMFLLTAVDKFSTSSRLLLPSRTSARKRSSCRRRVVSVGTLYGTEVFALAAAVESADVACSAARINAVVIVMSTITVV